MADWNNNTILSYRSYFLYSMDTRAQGFSEVIGIFIIGTRSHPLHRTMQMQSSDHWFLYYLYDMLRQKMWRLYLCTANSL